jgi:Mn2+/Fe2+ NRAMP family transporter
VIIVISTGIILMPRAPLIAITIWSQVINAMLLPVVLMSMILMVNNRRLMGNHTNNLFQNAVGWTTTIALIILTAMLIIPSVITPILNVLRYK